MKKIIAIFCVSFPLLLAAQRDSIVSGVYDWKQPVKFSPVGPFTILFEGQAHEMEWLQVSVKTSYAVKTKYTTLEEVPDSEERLIIVKSGTMIINVKDSLYTIGAGSIALLMPGETFSIQSKDTSCQYYLIKYKNRQPTDAKRYKTASFPKIINRDTVAFKPHDKGGRRDFLDIPTAMSKRVEIHATTLKAGLKSHDPHTHVAPEMVLVTEGQTEMQIGNQFYQGKAGSIYFLGSNVLHALQNKGTGNCTYFAVQLE